MNGEKGLEANQNQLIDIYKIHVELTNNVSNRRTTTNRFYQVFLSGLIVIFSAILQNKNGESVKFLDGVSIELIMVVLGGLGMWLSFIWLISVNSYLQLNSRKYEVLKQLEDELEYQFFQHEWELLGREKNKTYKYLSFPELLAPIVFFLFFLFIFIIGFKISREEDFSHRFLVLSAVLYPIFFVFSFWYLRFLRNNRYSTRHSTKENVNEEKNNGLKGRSEDLTR